MSTYSRTLRSTGRAMLARLLFCELIGRQNRALVDDDVLGDVPVAGNAAYAFDGIGVCTAEAGIGDDTRLPVGKEDSHNTKPGRRMPD